MKAGLILFSFLVLHDMIGNLFDQFVIVYDFDKLADNKVLDPVFRHRLLLTAPAALALRT